MTSLPELPGSSPVFEADDLDWAMGELLHMFWLAKRAGMQPCMQVIGCQPLEVGQRCIEIINDAKPKFVRWRS